MSNIKEFTAQIVETVNEIIKDNKITEPIQVQSLQMMGNGIFLCLKEALADKQRGAVLNEQITLPWKSAKRLLNFCFDKAKERAPKNSSGYGYAARTKQTSQAYHQYPPYSFYLQRFCKKRHI